MMKKYFLFSLLVFLIGCASIDIPNYIKDENPYRKNFNASYDDVLEATKQALTDSGWEITKSSDPAIYDQSLVLKKEGKQVLIFTDVRELGLVVGTRYARINTYVQSIQDDVTEVEIRYITANSVGFKTFYNYTHDQSVKRLFYLIERKLNKPQEASQ